MNDGKKISAVGMGVPSAETENNSNEIINHDSENINTILEKLTELLQMTKHCGNVTQIKKIGERAVVYYIDGSVKCVNISGDSGIAAIHDIVKKIMR